MRQTYIDPYFFYDADTLPDAPTVIEVGVFTANTARVVLARYPNARVICVEPDPVNFAALQAATAGLDIERIRAALTAHDGQTDIYHYACEQWHSTIPRHISEGLQLLSTARVDAFSLRSLLGYLCVDHCDLLNLNCEGGEIHALSALCADAELCARVGQVCTSFHCDHIHLYPPALRDELVTQMRARYNAQVGTFKEIPYWLFTRRSA